MLMDRRKDTDARIEALASLPTIGDVAKRFDVTLRFLRFYEEKGVLQPIRIGSTRIYDDAQQKRVAAIVRARLLGASVAEIQNMFVPGRQKRDAKILTEKVALLRKRRDVMDEELKRLEALIDLASTKGSDPSKSPKEAVAKGRQDS